MDYGQNTQHATLPLVGIIMGSDSDLPTMKQAAEALRDLGIPFELTIVSAHRTPQRMFDYARSAHTRGLRAIIAGAGGAAHLPGMVAALTPLPVIGVPIPIGPLGGQDALLSIVQMPRGVPVATVAIGNATNAGLLAARILAAADPILQRRMLAYQESLETSVIEKVARLGDVGWENYRQGKP
jgi:phosphoribosylaminoimidazole carboxylase PurE protein